MASTLVSADAIEVTEFPDLARKYSIRGVPKAVFNDRSELVGAADEAAFLDKAFEAVAPR